MPFPTLVKIFFLALAPNTQSYFSLLYLDHSLSDFKENTLCPELKFSLKFSFRVQLTIQRKMLCWGDKQNMAEIYREKSLRWIAFWGRTAIK